MLIYDDTDFRPPSYLSSANISVWLIMCHNPYVQRDTKSPENLHGVQDPYVSGFASGHAVLVGSITNFSPGETANPSVFNAT